MKSSLKVLSGIALIALMPMLADAQRGGQGESQGQGQDHRMHGGDMGEGMGMMNEERREHMEQMMEDAEQESHEH